MWRVGNCTGTSFQRRTPTPQPHTAALAVLTDATTTAAARPFLLLSSIALARSVLSLSLYCSVLVHVRGPAELTQLREVLRQRIFSAARRVDRLPQVREAEPFQRLQRLAAPLDQRLEHEGQRLALARFGGKFEPLDEGGQRLEAEASHLARETEEPRRGRRRRDEGAHPLVQKRLCLRSDVQPCSAWVGHGRL